MKKQEKAFILILGFMASMGIGAGGMYLANYKKIAFMNRYPTFLEAEEFVKETLEIAPPENSDIDAAASAYFALYGDKYTVFERGEDSDSKEYALEKVNNSSTAKKSGFRIQFNENDEPYFSAVAAGLPADEQGIKVGDIIKSVDDMEVTKYRHAVRLNGNDGETAKLIIERDGEKIAMDFVRCSDMSEITGVSTEKYGKTLYIAVDSMTSEVFAEFEKSVKENVFESLIIDLRKNSGGWTQTSVEIADLFIGKSETVMHAQNGQDEIYSTGDEITYDVPIVVLVNEKTASAAEILTALLKQYGDATLVGMNTFGKGIYQNLALFHGGNVKYTDGYVTVGDWENYHGKGIKPDIEIDMDSDYIGTDKDIQLEKAIELLK